MAHLGDQLSAYVDGRLSPAVLYAWDRHVLVCPACRQRVDEERRLLASLRAASAPGMSTNLQAMLLSLGDGRALSTAAVLPRPVSAPRWAPAGAAEGPNAPSPIPLAPESAGGFAALPERPSTATAPALPVLHRSLRRSIALAAVAAGASATAAWTLALVQAPVSVVTADATPVSATRPPAAEPGRLTARIGLAPAPSMRVLPVLSSPGRTDAPR